MFGLMNLDTGKCWGSEDCGSLLPENLNAYTERLAMARVVAVPKGYINFWTSGHKCKQNGCFRNGCVECHIPKTTPDIDNLQIMLSMDSIEHFCCDHAFKNGYCICCGEFWGGIEDFDFGNGLCDNCKDACDLEDGDPIEYEDMDVRP